MNNEEDSTSLSEVEISGHAGNDSVDDLCFRIGNIHLKNSILEEKDTPKKLKDEDKSLNVHCKSPVLKTEEDSLNGNEFVGESDVTLFARSYRTGVNAEGSPLANEVPLPVCLVPSCFPKNEGELLVIPVRRQEDSSKENKNISVKETDVTDSLESVTKNHDDCNLEKSEKCISHDTDNTSDSEVNIQLLKVEEDACKSVSSAEVTSTDVKNVAVNESNKVQSDLSVCLSPSKNLNDSVLVVETSSNSSIVGNNYDVLNDGSHTESVKEVPRNELLTGVIELDRTIEIFVEETEEEQKSDNLVSQTLVTEISESEEVVDQHKVIVERPAVINAEGQMNFSLTESCKELRISLSISENLNATSTENVLPAEKVQLAALNSIAPDASGLSNILTSPVITRKIDNGIQENFSLFEPTTVTALTSNVSEPSNLEEIEELGIISQENEPDSNINNIKISENTVNNPEIKVKQDRNIENENFSDNISNIILEEARVETKEDAIFVNSPMSVLPYTDEHNAAPVANETLNYSFTYMHLNEAEGAETSNILGKESARSEVDVTDNMNNAALCGKETILDQTFIDDILENEEKELPNLSHLSLPEVNKSIFSEHDMSSCNPDELQGRISIEASVVEPVVNEVFMEVPSSEIVAESPVFYTENIATERTEIDLVSLDTIEEVIETENCDLPMETTIKRCSGIHLEENIAGTPVDLNKSMSDAILHEELNATYVTGEVVEGLALTRMVLPNMEEAQLLKSLTISIPEVNRNIVSEHDDIVSVCITDDIQGSISNLGTNAKSVLNAALTAESSSEIKMDTSENITSEKTGVNLGGTETEKNVSPKETVYERDLNLTFTNDMVENDHHFRTPINDATFCEELNATFCVKETVLDATYCTHVVSDDVEAELDSSEINTNKDSENVNISPCFADGIEGNIADSKRTAKAVLNTTFTEVCSSERIEKMQTISLENLACRKNEYSIPASGMNMKGSNEFVDNSSPRNIDSEAVLNVTYSEGATESELNPVNMNNQVNTSSKGGKIITSLQSSKVALNSTFCEVITPSRAQRAEYELNNNKFNECSINNTSSILTNNTDIRGNVAYQKPIDENILNTTFSANCSEVENKVQNSLLEISSSEKKITSVASNSSEKPLVLNAISGNETSNILQISDQGESGISSIVSNCTLLKNNSQKETIRTLGTALSEKPKNGVQEMQMNMSSNKSFEVDIFNDTYVEADVFQENIFKNENTNLSSTFTQNPELSLGRNSLIKSTSCFIEYFTKESASNNVVNNDCVVTDINGDSNKSVPMCQKNIIEAVENTPTPANSIVKTKFVKILDKISTPENSGSGKSRVVLHSCEPRKGDTVVKTENESSSVIPSNFAKQLNELDTQSLLNVRMAEPNPKNVSEENNDAPNSSFNGNISNARNSDLQPSEDILPLMSIPLPKNDKSLKSRNLEESKDASKVQRDSSMVQQVNEPMSVEELINDTHENRHQMNINEKQTFANDKSAAQSNVWAGCQQTEDCETIPCTASSDSSVMSELPAKFDQPSVDIGQPHLESEATFFSMNEENCQITDLNFLLCDEVFKDPSSFDFLTRCGSTKSLRDLRKESLYLKFDPLVGSPHALRNVGKSIPILNISEEEKRNNCEEENYAEEDNSQDIKIDKELISGNQDCKSPTMPLNDPKNIIVHLAANEKEGYEKRIQALEAEKLELKESLKEKNEFHKAAVARYTSKIVELEFDVMTLSEENASLKTEIEKQGKEMQTFSSTVKEFEKLVCKLIVEKEDTSKILKELKLENERNQQRAMNAEQAFSESHKKFEGLKCIIKTLTENEKELLSKISRYEEALGKEKHKYEALKTHAATQLESANERMLAEQSRYKFECTKLNSTINQLELRQKSLQEELEQKSQENKQLMTMCSELVEQFQ